MTDARSHVDHYRAKPKPAAHDRPGGRENSQGRLSIYIAASSQRNSVSWPMNLPCALLSPSSHPHGASLTLDAGMSPVRKLPMPRSVGGGWEAGFDKRSTQHAVLFRWPTPGVESVAPPSLSQSRRNSHSLNEGPHPAGSAFLTLPRADRGGPPLPLQERERVCGTHRHSWNSNRSEADNISLRRGL